MAHDLRDRPVLHRGREGLIAIAEYLAGQVAESLQFVPLEVVPAILGEAVDEERLLGLPERNDAPESARLAFTFTCQPLFDNLAAEICVDQSILTPPDSSAEGVILDTFMAGEAGEGFRLKDAHAAPLHLP